MQAAAASAAAPLATIFATRLMPAEMIRIMLQGMLPLQRMRAATSGSRAAGLVLGVVIALGVSACGESSATYHSSLLRLSVGEYEISPESVRMPAGEVRIRLTNDGVLVHEVAIADSDGRIKGQTVAVFPGHTVTTRAFRLVPGTYRVYDPGANYADLGAYGALAVVAR
jgi:plastocyanin